MNFESFEKELKEMEAGQESGLSKLQEALREVGEEQERSSQHQQWAWARLRAEIEAQEEERQGVPLMVWKSFAVLGVLLLSVSIFMGPGSGVDLPEGPSLALDHEANTGALMGALRDQSRETTVRASPANFVPQVRKRDPNIYAVSFHSREAGADVIWVTGYRHVPSARSER